jgi:hypothetical protein
MYSYAICFPTLGAIPASCLVQHTTAVFHNQFVMFMNVYPYGERGYYIIFIEYYFFNHHDHCAFRWYSIIRKMTSQEVKKPTAAATAQGGKGKHAHVELVIVSICIAVMALLTGDGAKTSIPKSLWMSVWLTFVLDYVICISITWGKKVGPNSRIESYQANKMYRDWMDNMLHSIGNEPWKNYRSAAILSKRKTYIGDDNYYGETCDTLQQELDAWVNSLLESGVVLSEEIMKTKPQFRYYAIYKESFAGTCAILFIVAGPCFTVPLLYSLLSLIM